jgi:hypothetical protein
MVVEAVASTVEAPSLAVTRTAIVSPRVVSLAGSVAVVRLGTIVPLRLHWYVSVTGSPSGSMTFGTTTRSAELKGCGGVSVSVNVGAGLPIVMLVVAVAVNPRPSDTVTFTLIVSLRAVAMFKDCVSPTTAPLRRHSYVV